ncbi:hypothetical protein ACFVH6_08640 [Spirillospora sp. NPDC127200]
MEKFFRDVLNGEPVAQGAQPYISVTVLAASAVDPRIDLNRLVADPMKPQLRKARSECIGALFGLPRLQPGQYLTKGPDADKLLGCIKAQDPSSNPTATPRRPHRPPASGSWAPPACATAPVARITTRASDTTADRGAGGSAGSVARWTEAGERNALVRQDWRHQCGCARGVAIPP